MSDDLEIRKAERTRIKVKIGMSGVYNSGKTKGALRLAYGLCGKKWDKIIVVSSEPNQSADIYANEFCDDTNQYSVIDLTQNKDYSPEQYIRALRLAESGGFEVVILDTITHEWDDILDSVDRDNKAAEAQNKKLFGNGWLENGARHKAFLQAIMTSSCHVILTCRQDEEIVMVTENGKQRRKVVGMKDLTRKNWTYDLNFHFILEAETHLATTNVDKSGMFINEKGVVPFLIDESIGERIREWANIGVDVAAEKNDLIYNIGKSESGVDLGIYWDGASAGLHKNVEIQQAFLKRAIEVVDNAKNGKELAKGYKLSPQFMHDDAVLKKTILQKAIQLVPEHETIAELAEFWEDMCNKDNPALPFVKADKPFYDVVRAHQQGLVQWESFKKADDFASIYKLLPCKPTETDKAYIKKAALELIGGFNSEEDFSAACVAIVGNNVKSEPHIPPSIPFLKEDKEFVGAIFKMLQEIKDRPPVEIELPDFNVGSKTVPSNTGTGNKRREVTKVKFPKKGDKGDKK